MLIDDRNQFSDNQAITVTGTGTKVIDSTEGGNAKLNELFVHASRSSVFTSDDDEATLTIDTILTAGDTFTIGDSVYTAVTDGTAHYAGQVDVGANVVETAQNIIVAINGDTWNVANASCSVVSTTSTIAATGNLAVSGVVIDGETVTITNGTLTDIYEFAADAAQTVTSGNIAVDIEGDTTKSQGTLTVDTQVDATDTITLGTTTYIFRAGATALANEIGIGDNVGECQAAILAAINGTDGFNDANLSAYVKTVTGTVAATSNLAVSGVVLHGETVTCGVDTYEFAADVAQTVTSGNIAVDITAVTTGSAGTITMDTQPVAGKVIVIGSKTYTWVPLGTANADGEVDVGADLAAAKVNIVAAINGTDGITTANTSAYAATFAANTSLITAFVAGVAGDSITFTTTMAAGTNGVDGAGTLGTTTAGVDCTAANAITALVAAEVASGTEPVVFADVDTANMSVTANALGYAGNAIATTEEMVNGAFTAATLTGGSSETFLIEALIGGVAGDLIDSTSSFTTGTNQFDAVKLGTTQAGVDCIAADAITALVAAQTASGTAEVTFADVDTANMSVTADNLGLGGNLYATTETMANGAFTTDTLIGGDLVIPLVPKVGGTGDSLAETFSATNNVFSGDALTSTTLTFLVRTSATITGTAPTTTLNGTVTTLVTSEAIPIAEINANREIFVARMPEGALQYIGVAWTIANGPFTAGNINVSLNAEDEE